MRKPLLKLEVLLEDTPQRSTLARLVDQALDAADKEKHPAKRNAESEAGHEGSEGRS